MGYTPGVEEDDDLDEAAKGGLPGLLPFGLSNLDLHVSRIFWRKSAKGKFYVAVGTVLASDRKDVPVGSRWGCLWKITDDETKKAMYLRGFANLVAAVSNVRLDGGQLKECKKALLEACADEEFDLNKVVRCISTEREHGKGEIDPKTGQVKKFTNREFNFLGDLANYKAAA